jgi:cold shock CspA family protein
VKEYFYGAARKRAARPAFTPAHSGAPGRGTIAKLLIGQGYGFIRVAGDRRIYFHRSDVDQGCSFNRFAVGDAVSFELLEDPVSGPRARDVKDAGGRADSRRGV